MQFRFAKCKKVEATFILYIIKDFHLIISTHLKYFRKEHACILNVERIHYRCVKGFTSSNLAMVAYAFDFMTNLNIYCWMSREAIDRASSTQTPLLPNLLGWEKVVLIISKYLWKHFFASNYNQYCGYTTPKSSMTPWVRKLSLVILQQSNQ